MTDAALSIQKLTRRSEFLACAKAPYCARGAVVVQALPREDDSALVRVGFTATKRIGGAVQRNRAKRRLREAARQILPLIASPGTDYVIIARTGVITRNWTRLLDDVKSALLRLAADRKAPHVNGPVPSPAGNPRPRS
ncbi:ribonuclease P protein component [Phenylobacterium sp.]|uniref:ribonuclease P protein component n=1 Tax=Phenylobacterium sp. TaxID=1871053 RepID=UPI0037C90586